MLMGILIGGAVLLWLVFQLFEGILKFFFVVFLLIAIILVAIFSGNSEPGPSSGLEISHVSDEA